MYSGRDFPYGFNFSILVRKLFQNLCGKIEMLILFSREIQEEIFHMDLIFQFFSFGWGIIPDPGRGFLYGFNFFILVRKLSHIYGEKKTLKKKNTRKIQEEILHINLFIFFFFKILLHYQSPHSRKQHS